MSIYTITLKRELLNSKGRPADCGQADWLQGEQSIGEPTSEAAKRLISSSSGSEGQVYGYNRNSSTVSRGSSATADERAAINACSFDGNSEIYDSPAAVSLAKADWLHCLCDAKQRLSEQVHEEQQLRVSIKDKKNNKEPTDTDSKYMLLFYSA